MAETENKTDTKLMYTKQELEEFEKQDTEMLIEKEVERLYTFFHGYFTSLEWKRRLAGMSKTSHTSTPVAKEIPVAHRHAAFERFLKKWDSGQLKSDAGVLHFRLVSSVYTYPTICAFYSN